MGARRKARELALQALYSIDIARSDVDKTIDTFLEAASLNSDARLFAERLVRGVIDNREALDRTIEAVSEHWSLYRMALIDRNILRLSSYEILYCEDVPPAVSINEAVEIAKRFGDDNSPAFINGLLDRIAHAEKK